MRSWVFGVLIACGGGTASAPPPVSNQAPPSNGPAHPVVAKACDDTSSKCILESFGAFTERVCSCADKACAEKVTMDMTKWSSDLAEKAKGQQPPPDPDMPDKMTKLSQRYSECMMKVYSAEPPQPDPCGGGADPCGAP